MLNMGIVPMEDMFTNAQSQNASLTWLLRGVGWLLNWLALTMMTQVVVAMCRFSICCSLLTAFPVSIIPLVSNLVQLGRCVFTITLSVTCSLLVIALGWIRSVMAQHRNLTLD